jgi:acyl-CoA synthetase (AMP-forming)/AMP-acid ligase II/aryl carrier-like protein
MQILDIAQLGTRPSGAPREERAGSDVALMLHTSGTTAKPKIVPLTHENLRASASNIAAWLGLSAYDRCHNVMPLFHIHGLAAALLASLSAGASVVCSTGFVAPEFFAQLRAHRPTWYTAVPTMHRSILSRAPDEAPPSPLRFVRSASAPLPPQTARGLADLFGAPVVEPYGMTEAAHQICSNPLGSHRARWGSVGMPAGSDVAILDERGDLVARGAIGEVAIRGANVTAGYVGDPAANARAFVRGWFRTGDLGRFDGDGYLFLEGRIKELINRGGEKISPREIDEVLMNHPSVVQAAAFGMPDERLGDEVAAVVVLAPKATTDERSLMRFAAEYLADWKVPRRITIVDELPKGPTGKLVRTGLAAALGLDRAKCAPEVRQPIRTSGFEELLAEIWCEVLHVEAVDPEADFLALGGDSVLAAQVIARVRKRCGRELSIVAFFDRPTLAAMAVAVAQAPSVETP